MQLVPMKRYRIAVPKGDPDVVTYTGHYPDADFRCDVCRKEGRGGHEFLVGDPENPTYAYHIGTACIRKCKIVPVENEELDTMRRVFALAEARAGFPREVD